MGARGCFAVALVAVCATAEVYDGSTRYDDWHYPHEESRELAGADVPLVLAVYECGGAYCALLKDPSTGVQQNVSTPSLAFGVWHVMAVLGEAAPQRVVAQRAFDRWGLLAFAAVEAGATVALRKPVGELAELDQPYFNFTGRDPHYFEHMADAAEDFPAVLAAKLTTDGTSEVDFEALASTLAPQRDYVGISNNADVVKFAVTYAGRVKCAFRGPGKQTTGGIVELQDQTRPAANAQKLVFDPARLLPFWPRRFEATKTGLLGGVLNAANVGAFSASQQGGFELIAFTPSSAAAGEGPARINYSPTVYVGFRQQTSGVWGANDSVQYFAVSNATAEAAAYPQITAEEFYAALLGRWDARRKALSSAASVTLPGAQGARQRDTAVYSMLAAVDNYVGNQSNYGFGATYWSYGREDNGSLPLNILSVDEALLEWGMQDTARAHIGYYFDNYVDKATADMNYTSWGASGDSVSDFGRLVCLYLRAVRLAPADDAVAAAWATRYLPYAQALGRKLLALRAQRPAAPPAGSAGLLEGAPEHDWSGVTKKCFYNNNVWTLRGMEMLGAYLSEGGAPLNATLGSALLADAKDFRAAIAASVAACTVDGGAAGTFLPPYAAVNATPYRAMTESKESSYSNFRFWSESILADNLPRATEDAWLTYHYTVGGSLGGASRFNNSVSRLDDMPTAGWGYGALAHNRTDDFLQLLYGHMATYHSRGAFHSTEQLSFQGQGLYRALLWYGSQDDPVPPAGAASLGPTPQPAVGGTYFRESNDVSFCIVSMVLTARLTRWQLVFEDLYRADGGRGRVWLGRGAPLRWFNASGGGKLFGAARVPTEAGSVTFSVSWARPSTLAYDVSVEAGAAAADVDFVVKFPRNFAKAACDSRCSVVSEDAGKGFVRVTGSLRFTVAAEMEALDEGRSTA